MAFFIRPAQEKDAEAIVDLIKVPHSSHLVCFSDHAQDLAIYEKEPESAKATPELIRDNLFKHSYASALLAFEGSPSSEGQAIGLALYFFSASASASP